MSFNPALVSGPLVPATPEPQEPSSPVAFDPSKVEGPLVPVNHGASLATGTVIDPSKINGPLTPVSTKTTQSPDDAWLSKNIKENNPGLLGNPGNAGINFEAGLNAGMAQSIMDVNAPINFIRSKLGLPVGKELLKQVNQSMKGAITHDQDVMNTHPAGSVYSAIGGMLGGIPAQIAEWGSGGKEGEVLSAAFYGLQGMANAKGQPWYQVVRQTVAGVAGRAMLGRLMKVPAGRLGSALNTAGGVALLNQSTGGQNTWGSVAGSMILGGALGHSVDDMKAAGNVAPHGQPSDVLSEMALMKSQNPELFDKMVSRLQEQAVNAGVPSEVRAVIKNPVLLTHFSPKGDLNVVSSKFAETNPSQKGAERGVYSSKFAHFYGGGRGLIAAPETGLGNNRYEAIVDKDSLFDAGTHPEDAKVIQDHYNAMDPMTPQNEKLTSFMNDLPNKLNPRTGKGYAGFISNGTVGMYDDVPVVKVPLQGSMKQNTPLVTGLLQGLRTQGRGAYSVAHDTQFLGKDTHQVDMFPERTQTLDHEPTHDEISEYASQNQDLLKEPSTIMTATKIEGKKLKDGTTEPDIWRMGISAHERNYGKAYALAEKNGAHSLRHLGSGKEVFFDNGGEQPTDPAMVRLKEAKLSDEIPPDDAIRGDAGPGAMFRTEKDRKVGILSFLRQRYAQAVQQSTLNLQLETASDTLSAFDEDHLYELSSQYAKTGSSGDPLADTAFNQIKIAMEKQRQFERNIAGMDYELRQNYLPAFYKEGPTIENMTDNPPANMGMGKATFVRQKVFDTPMDAVNAGYLPITANSAIMAQARIVYGSIAAAKIGSMKDAVDAGLATEGEGAPRSFQPIIIGGKRYMAHPKVVKFMSRMYNGARINPDEYTEGENKMWGIGSKLFQYAMKAKNATTYTVMSMSAFHLNHVLHIDTMNELAAAVEIGEKAGDTSAMKGFRPTPTSNALVGSSLIDAWHKPYADMTEPEKVVANTFAVMGIVPGRPTLYNPARTALTVENALDETFEGVPSKPNGILAGATVIANATRETMARIQGPLFEQLIPSLKSHAAFQGMWDMVRADPSLLENDPQNVQRLRIAATNLGSQIDLRFGELQYNRYLWHPMLKKAAFLTFLSVGWNVGFIHQFLGGVGDLAQAGLRSAKTRTAPELTNRAMYASSYLMTGALITGALSYMLTGQAPTVKGMFYVKTPGTARNPDGGYESTMFFNREFSGMVYHVRANGILGGPTEAFLDKMAPIWAPTHEIIENRDYFGNQIYDENAPVYDQVLQAAKHAGLSFLPISMGPFEAGTADPTTLAESFAGLNPAAGYVEHSNIYQSIIDRFSLTHGGETTPYSAIPLKNARRDVVEAYNKYGVGSPQMNEALKNYQELNPTANLYELIEGLNGPQGASMFKQLDPGQQIALFTKYGKEMKPYIPYLSHQALPILIPEIEKMNQ